jgi:hypothetical protein
MYQNGDPKQGMYHTEDPQKLDATVQNLVDQKTWCPEICTPGLTFYPILEIFTL